MARHLEELGLLAHRHPDPRILLISMREICPYLSHANLYEFENLVAELDQVDVLAPSRLGGSAGRLGVAGKTRRRIAEEIGTRFDRTNRAEAPYDLVLFVFQNLVDLDALRPLQRWISLGRRSACMFQECWATSIVPGRSDFERLNCFDHIFLSADGSVGPLGDCLRTTVAYIPFGVDAAVFSPVEPGRPRSIDFYALGRRHEKMHTDLIAYARAENFFYAFDSIMISGTTRFKDFSEHRLLTGRMIQSSRFFAVNRGRFDTPDLIADQDEVNPRFYEGASAGASLVGPVPRTPRFAELMGWKDAVFSFDPDQQEIVPFLQELDRQGDRLEVARRTGVRECLRRHDWMFRWRMLLETLGLDEPETLARREEMLHKRAERWVDPA